VDCSRSTELYEQSAEQLAEEEKKRADARKMKSEYHRTEQQGDVNDYDGQSIDYDGRQNGRTNPYGQIGAKQNQLPERRQEEAKSAQNYGPNNVFDNVRDTGRYFQGNSANTLRANGKINQLPENFSQPVKQRTYHDGGSSHQTSNRQRNQLVDTQTAKFNYEQGNKLQDARQNYQTTSSSAQSDRYRENQNAARDNEKPEFRGPKSRTSTRNNLFGSSQSQKATPTYMETTTFRTTTASPPREYQQFAESAAFVSNRGNRFNSAKYDGNRQFYYQSYEQRDRSGNRFDSRETTTLPTSDENSEKVSFTPKPGVPPFPGPTYAPIYKARTTTLPPYETTLQYTPTTETNLYSSHFYRQSDVPETTYFNYDTTTIVTPSTAEEYPTTESFTVYNDQRTPPAIGRIPPATGNYRNQYTLDSKVTNQRDNSRDIASFATTRPYANTENYRHTAANLTSAISQDTYSSSTPFYETSSRDQNGATTYANYPNSVADTEVKGTTKNPWSASQSTLQNSISSTEKPWKSTNVYQQNGSTSKTLSPYDTSFTYKQGKVLSTLGPYVPFTKNYVYSTSTSTPKPLATVPTYSPTNYRITTSNLIPKMKSSTTVTRTKDRATYLPEVGTRPSTTLENRPYAEREHALSMLHSLQGLENNVNSFSESDKKETGSSRNWPPAPGPSTLHSLALYFATAGDSFGSKETSESIASREANSEEGGHVHNASIELPTSILTQHTITSYAELFNLNNALEGNVTMTELAAEVDDIASEIDSDDLEIEQSEGPLNGARRSQNSTKLRELAQVFTHALSAYLQDPDTFKKVLTEIRPTEPSLTTSDGGQYEATTLYPTTAEEYASVTKEKDEVLDFSDDTDAARRRKPSTTLFPTTLQPPVTSDHLYSTSHTTSYDGYYSTDQYSTRRPIYYPSTTLLPPGSDDSRDYSESSTQAAQGGNTFAFEVNRAFTTTIRGYDGDMRDTTDLSLIYDNYFPEDEGGNRNRLGGFHNNTSRTFQPYGKNVKPIGATPISNYVSSSTPASFQNFESTTLNWGRGSAGDRPIQNLTPPHYQRFGNLKSFEVSNSIVPSHSTTPLPRSKSAYETISSTVQPFRIHYYESTTTAIPENRKANSESLVTARSSYTKYRNNYNRSGSSRALAENVATTTIPTTRDSIGTLDPISVTYSDTDVPPYSTTVARATSDTPANASSTVGQQNNHWTSSPTVTHLWETTVFVDPRHINHGLESNSETSHSQVTTSNAVSDEFMEPTTVATTARSPFFNEVPEESRITTSTPSPWQWAPNDNDSPIAFTLLPTTYTAENTATPTPIITTRSTITTTITSSVTSTNSVPRDASTSTLLPFTVTAGNSTENEVIKAQEMFGKLNETSSDTLMRVMKQADSNETVRQLVLLLISHCNGPRNKTTEQEKEQLLDALLRLPVNEFSSEESREIVADINRLHVSDGMSRYANINDNV